MTDADMMRNMTNFMNLRKISQTTTNFKRKEKECTDSSTGRSHININENSDQYTFQSVTNNFFAKRQSHQVNRGAYQYESNHGSQQKYLTVNNNDCSPCGGLGKIVKHDSGSQQLSSNDYTPIVARQRGFHSTQRYKDGSSRQHFAHTTQRDFSKIRRNLPLISPSQQREQMNMTQINFKNNTLMRDPNATYQTYTYQHMPLTMPRKKYNLKYSQANTMASGGHQQMNDTMNTPKTQLFRSPQDSISSQYKRFNYLDDLRKQVLTKVTDKGHMEILNNVRKVQKLEKSINQRHNMTYGRRKLHVADSGTSSFQRTLENTQNLSHSKSPRSSRSRSPSVVDELDFMHKVRNKYMKTVRQEQELQIKLQERERIAHEKAMQQLQYQSSSALKIQSAFRMYRVRKAFSMFIERRKVQATLIIQRFSRGYLDNKQNEWNKQKHRYKIDTILAHFRQIKFLEQTDAQIKIRFAWRIYKRVKARKEEERKAKAAKKKGKYGGYRR